MTAVLGVLCQDGVVLGSDGANSAVTQGGRIQYERAKYKVWTIGNCAMGVSSGSATVGQWLRIGVQRFCHKIDREDPDVYNAAENLQDQILRTMEKVGLEPSSNDKALVALSLGDSISLIQFSGATMVPKLVEQDLHYESIGGGSRIVAPFFEFLKDIFWERQLPTVDEATIGVVWAMQHAIATSGAGVRSPISVGIMRKDKAPHILTPAEVSEEAEEYILRMKNALKELMKPTATEDQLPDY